MSLDAAEATYNQARIVHTPFEIWKKSTYPNEVEAKKWNYVEANKYYYKAP